MNRPVQLLCALLILLGLPALVGASTTTIPLGEVDFSHSDPALTVTKGNLAYTTISFVAPQVALLDSTVGFETYRTAAIPGEPVTPEDGQPTVPAVSRLYRIPNTGSVTLEITAAEYDVVEDYNPFPAQPDDGSFPAQLVKNANTYSKSEWYPRDVAVMSQPMILRDLRLVAVTLNPVQVNPVTHQARIYRQIEVSVIANDSPGENEIVHTRRMSHDWAAMYRTVVANLDESALDEFSITPGTYLLCTRNDATSLQWADSLATWKRRAGYSVIVDSRASWTTTSLKSRAQTLYDQQDLNPPLEYICILGDANGTYGIPTTSTDPTGKWDHDYALLAGNDDLEDVSVGRLSCNSASQMSVVVDKVLAYERTPYMADTIWFKTAFLYCGVGTTTPFTSNHQTMLWGRNQFYHFTGMDTVYVDTHTCDAGIDVSHIVQRLNAGVGYFLWRGCVIGEMQNTVVNGCGNGTRLPICLTITCGTGTFDDPTQSSVSEAWLQAGSGTTLKGGVCGIGTALLHTKVQFNNTVAGGLIYGICNAGMDHVGPALSLAKVQLHAAFPNFTGDYGPDEFSAWNNLMGDPALSMWKDKPVIFNVTYPGTVNVGTRRVRPQVTDSLTGEPIEDALVVLWKGSECYAQALTDAGGFADVPVVVNSAGTMTLTVTKHNHKPFLADIQCADTPEMVTVSSIMLDDDNVGGTQGNDNGILNPGETIDLSVYLRNFGTSQTADTATAVLSCDNTHVTVVNGTCRYGSIAPGDSATASTSFRISAAAMMKENEDVILTFAVTTGSNISHSSVRLTCKAGDAVFVSTTVVGGDGDAYLEPGESATLRVTIRNMGDLDMDNVTGVLRTYFGFVNCTADQEDFGAIAIGATGSNTGHEFPISCNSLAYRGFPAQMLLILTTGGGFVDSVRFSIPLGQAATTDPTGPDSYGYFAYDNTDTTYEMHPHFAYVDVSDTTASGGHNLHINDPGEEVAITPVYSSVRDLPFPFMYYGQTYGQITICANGWAAFGNQGDHDQFRNYPIPGEQAPDAMLAPFWDDLKTSGTGNGVWDCYQADSNRYVIQWKAKAANGTSYTVTEQFEIILLDPAHYPTRDGNGIIVFQYSTISDVSGQENDVHYSTIGIEAPGCTVGLQYRFNNNLPAGPGVATLVSGRAITFTTEGRTAFGSVRGTVANFSNQSPMPGVIMSLDGQTYRDTTDATGHYLIPDVLVSSYSLRAQYPGFNDGVNENTVIPLNDTITVSLAMHHPEIGLSVPAINVTLPTDPQQAFFNITNPGNGPLDYNIHIDFSGGGPLDNAWDLLDSVDVGGATGDNMLWGCELIGDRWWVTGANNGDPTKYFYRFDLEGNLVDQIPQPSTDGLGWFDLAYDGQNVYGSNGSMILGVDMNGVVQDTVPSPLSPTRALAYDPQAGHFWVADYTSGVYEIDRNGAVLHHFMRNIQITGLAWNPSDPQGYRLYVFARDSVGQHAIVSRMHPVSGDFQMLATLDRRAGDRATGCSITPNWNSTMLVFAGILRGTTNTQMGIWELDFNTTWITVTPMIASVPGGGVREVEVDFNPASLRPSTYHVGLSIHNNSAAGTQTLPVTLTVLPSAVSDRTDVPKQYALFQNYPNPFNGRTTFHYDLKQPGRTTLRVYNLLGQEVATLVDKTQPAGSFSLNRDMHGLASGLYLYRLESGSFVQTRKLMLLR